MNRIAVGLTLVVLAVVAGCKKEGASASSGGKVQLQLNWHPEPQFGGFYAADQNGAFKKHGLDVEVVPGGVGTPTVQMVGNGKVDFAVVSADELLIARERGNNVVALFAVYQTNPQGIMTHAGRGFKGIGDVFQNDGTVGMQKGLPYADFLLRKYGPAKANLVPSPGGDLTLFLKDPKYSMQCFVTSEPIAARRAKADEQTFLVAASGYNPYTTVLVTREDYLKAHPDTAKAMVAACREGWQAYLDNPGPTNDAMGKLNPGMDAQTFVESAKAQEPLIRTDETTANGLGYMSRERWQTLGQQLVELGVIKVAPPAEQCFVWYAPEAGAGSAAGPATKP